MNYANFSDATSGSWLKHIYREQNAAADKVADRASLTGVASLRVMCPEERPDALRLTFDGTAGKTGQSGPAAGIVIAGATKREKHTG